METLQAQQRLLSHFDLPYSRTTVGRRIYDDAPFAFTPLKSYIVVDFHKPVKYGEVPNRK